MSGITLEKAQAALDALVAAQIESAGTASVSIDGKTVTYSSLADIIEGINYWQGVVTRLQRIGAGGSSLGYSVASFNRTRR